MEEFDYVFGVQIGVMEAVQPEEIVGEVVRCYNWSINARQVDLAVQMATIFKTLLYPGVQCYGGFLGYFQGMLCFSCEPNWSTYYNAMQEVLTLSQNTCNGVYETCQWFENSVQSALLQILPLFIQLLQADDDPYCCTLLITELNYVLSALKGESICQFAAHKSCQDVLCQDLLRGLNYGPDYNRTPDCVVPPNNLNNAPTFFINKLLGLASSLAKKQTLKAPVGYVKNAYSSQGFDAYSIGCGPSLSTYGCPDVGSDKSNWKMVVIIGGSVIGAIVLLSIVVIICRRKRAAEAVALDDNLPKYNRLDGGAPETQTHEGGMIQ
jgi:hypothetical protein